MLIQIECASHSLFLVSINDGSAFFAVVKVGVAVSSRVYRVFALIVGALHLLFSHSYEETVFKGFLLIAWAGFAQ